MNRLRIILLQGFLFLMPLVRVSGIQDRVTQENYFKYLGMCLFASFSPSIWAFLFMALNVFLFVYNGQSVGLAQVLNVFVGIAIFTASKAFFKYNDWKIIKTPILCLTALSLGLTIFQLFGIDPIFVGQSPSGQVFDRAFTDPVGFFNIKMAQGFFMLVATIILSVSNAWFLFIMAPIIYLSKSVSVYSAFFIWAIFLSYFRVRKYFPHILVAGCLIAAFGVYHDYKDDPKTFVSRFPVWHATTRYSLLRPIGYGPDSYRSLHGKKDFLFKSDGDYNLIVTRVKGDTEYGTFYSMSGDSSREKEMAEKLKDTGLQGNTLNFWDNPHNFLLQMMFQYGVLGLFILVGFLREIILRFKNADKTKEILICFGIIMAYFVAGLTNFPLELARTAYLFPIVLGLFYSRTS